MEPSEAQPCQVRFQRSSAATAGPRVASQTVTLQSQYMVNFDERSPEGRTGRWARQPGEPVCSAEKKSIQTCSTVPIGH